MREKRSGAELRETDVRSDGDEEVPSDVRSVLRPDPIADAEPGKKRGTANTR